MAAHAERTVDSWPPKIGSRVHYNSGHKVTSWSAIVLGIYDDYQVAMKRWLPHKQYWLYFFQHSWWWEEGHIRKGPLPKKLEG